MKDSIDMTDDERLRDMIAECIEKAADLDEAVPMLLERLEGDSGAHAALLRPWRSHAARVALGAEVRRVRRMIWNNEIGSNAEQQATPWARESAATPSPAAPYPQASDARVAHLANAVAASLFDFPLPGGKRLSDATGAEVRAAADAYRMRAADMGWKARWLDRIAARVAETETVSAALDAATLAQLRQEAADNA